MTPIHQLILSTAALCALVPFSRAQAPTRVLCIGDSLTNGAANLWSNYRGPLFNRLASLNHCVDFVGTRRGELVGGTWPEQFQNDVNLPATDQDHFGFSSRQSIAVLAELFLAQTGSASAEVKCDVALIHLGSNDVLQLPWPPQDIADRVYDSLKQMIGLLQAQNPGVKIFIAEIIPMNIPGTAATISLVNAGIRNLNDPQTEVRTVDMNTPFQGTFGLNYADPVHLNTIGADLMARLWQSAILPHLTPVNPQPTDACFREYGRGCIASGPSDDPRFLLTNSAVRPTLNTTLPLLVTGIPAGAALGLGLSLTIGQLPTGANDCFSFLGAPVITPLMPPAMGNQLAVPLPIPNDPNLIGVDIFGQVVMVDPTNAVHLTNGIWARIGN